MPPPAPPWTLVPRHLRVELQTYLEHGTPPRSEFLIAVLSNDLVGAATRSRTGHELLGLIDFLVVHFPPLAWGTGERIATWETMGGLDGEIAA